MKVIRSVRTTLLTLGVVLLASCGGGGEDESGTVDGTFSLSATEFTFTWGTGQPCGALTDALRVYVYGGAAPYQVNVNQPLWVSVDRSTVAKNGYFLVSYTGTGNVCFDPATITVVDALNRTRTLTLKSTAGT